MQAVIRRCPHGAPAVISQHSYLESGEPFPTTYYLTCPHAVGRVGRIEDAGGVDRYRRLAAAQPALRRSLAAAGRHQRRLRRPAAAMVDGGASLLLGIGGSAGGGLACLHAHAAFALAHPGYLLGERILAEAAPLFPEHRCCCR
ncbi:MAG TPA: DUF501 domain-containing protein [Gaiellales bacterium]|nr:DUF501 domain-containing protein [Gaiellales bacterium]